MNRVHFSRSVTVRFSADEWERFEQAMFWKAQTHWKVSDHVREAIRVYCHLVQNTYDPAKVEKQSTLPAERKTPAGKRKTRSK